jgi:DNA ligase (NAD+)
MVESVKKKVKQLQEYDRLYYEGKPATTDSAYDRLKDSLRELDPNNPYFKAVGSKAVKGEKKKLPIPLGSMVKRTPENVEDWLKKLPKNATFVCLPKLDGQAGELEYVDGELVAAYTRGDGIIGRVVTNNAKYVQGVRSKLKPSKFTRKGRLIVKGEFIIHNKLFEAWKSKEYKAARNFVVGMLNRIELDEETQTALRDITFVAFNVQQIRDREVIAPAFKHQTMLYLALMGFTTIINPVRYSKGHYSIKKQSKKMKSLKEVLPVFDVKNTLQNVYIQDRKTITSSFLKNTMAYFKKTVDILQDGIVLEVQERSIAEKLGVEADGITPAFARAIKLDVTEQESRIGKVEKVEWGYTKRRLFKPVAILKKPVDFNGVEVSNITLHNYATAKKLSVGPGAKIKIIRSGDVIPRIMGVKRKAKSLDNPTKCPYCNTKLAKNETDLLCPNRKCEGASVEKIHAFFSTIGVDYVSVGIIQQLIEAGYSSIPELLSLRAKDLAKLEGFGEKRAKIVAKNLANCLKGVRLSKIMHASGYFQDETTGLGSTRCQAIIDELGIRKVLNMDVNDKMLASLSSIDGIGPTASDLFMKGILKFRKFYQKIEASVSLEENAKLASKKLLGQGFGFTGFRSTDLEKLITSNGGVVTNGVTGKTTCLFAAQAGTTKAQKAAAKGIKIVSAAKAEEHINKLIS